METNEIKNVDAAIINELLQTWEKNEKARKANEFLLIQDTVNAMMLPQIQKIMDDQDQANERFERNILKIRERQERMKNGGDRGKCE